MKTADDDLLLDLKCLSHEGFMKTLCVFDPRAGQWMDIMSLSFEDRSSIITKNYLRSNGSLRIRFDGNNTVEYICLVPSRNLANLVNIPVPTNNRETLRQALTTISTRGREMGEFVLSPIAAESRLCVNSKHGGELYWNDVQMTSGQIPILTIGHSECRSIVFTEMGADFTDDIGNHGRFQYETRGDRIAVTISYHTIIPRDQAWPITFQLKAAQPAKPKGVAHILLSSNEHIDCCAEIGQYRNYVVLGATSLGYLALEDGAFLGVFDPEMSGCIFRGKDDGAVEVTRWLYPSKRGQKYEWSFEVLTGYESFPAALLRATWPYTITNKDVIGGAMGRIDKEKSGRIDLSATSKLLEEAKNAGVGWILKHDWCSEIGNYYRFEDSDEDEYLSMDLIRLNRNSIRHEGNVIHEAGLKYFLYTGFSNCSTRIESRFAQAQVRDENGFRVISGYDVFGTKHDSNTWLNPSLELPYAQSMLKQMDKLCQWDEMDGIYIDGLSRTDNLLQRGLWDRGHFDGSAAPIDYYENGSLDLPPASSLALASKDYFKAVRGLLDKHGKYLICNMCRSMWIARLADAFQIEMHINPDIILFSKCLGNGKNMSIKGNVKNYSKKSQTTGLARNVVALLTQNYPAPQDFPPVLAPFRNQIEVRPQRLLAIIPNQDNRKQIWLFPKAMSLLSFHPDKEVYPDNLNGSYVEYIDNSGVQIKRICLYNNVIEVGYSDGSQASFNATNPTEYDEVVGKAIMDEGKLL